MNLSILLFIIGSYVFRQNLVYYMIPTISWPKEKMYRSVLKISRVISYLYSHPVSQVNSTLERPD